MELVRRIFDRIELEYVYILGAILFSGLCAYFLPLVAVPFLIFLAVLLISLSPKALVACYMVFIPLHLAVLNIFETGGGDVGAYSLLGGIKDVLFLAVLISYVVFWRMNGRLRRSEPIPFALFLVFVAVMLLHVPPQGVKIGLMGFKSSAEFALAFLIGAGLGALGLRAALWALVASSLPAMVYGFVQVATEGFTYVVGAKVVTLAGRAAGVFGDLYAANSYGMYLVIVIIAAFYLFEDSKRFWRGFALVCALAAAASLVLTFSRRSWISLVFGMLLYSYFARSRKALIPIVAASLAGVLIAPLLFIDRLKMLFSLSGASAIGRFVEWREILHDVFFSPWTALWGYGLGAYGPVPTSLEFPGAINSHSYYFLTLGQMGLVGLFTFLVFVCTVLVFGVRRIRRSDPEADGSHRRISAMFLGSVCALLLSSTLGIIIETFPANFIFWLFCGALVSRDY